jgi:hypothetical protein
MMGGVKVDSDGIKMKGLKVDSDGIKIKGLGKIKF